MLKIVVTCRCGSRYEINESCGNIGFISCPNCRAEMDQGNQRAIGQFISGANAIHKSDSVNSMLVDFRLE